MSTHYTAYDKDAEYGSNAFEGEPLKAKTDQAARTEAKKIAKEKAWKSVGIKFFRDSDHCKGEMDV